MMPTVRSFASGRSTAANRTPLSRSVSRKAALRDSRSSLAMTSVAPVTLARCSACLEFRPVRVAPALHLGEAGDEAGAALSDEAVDRQPLRLDAEPAGALARRADPLVADDPRILRASVPQLPNVRCAVVYALRGQECSGSHLAGNGFHPSRSSCSQQASRCWSVVTRSAARDRRRVDDDPLMQTIGLSAGRLPPLPSPGCALPASARARPCSAPSAPAACW